MTTDPSQTLAHIDAVIEQARESIPDAGGVETPTGARIIAARISLQDNVGPRMSTTLKAVLALHKPDPFGSPERPTCDHCLDVVGDDQPNHPDGVAWPCPTVLLLTAELVKP